MDIYSLGLVLAEILGFRFTLPLQKCGQVIMRHTSVCEWLKTGARDVDAKTAAVGMNMMIWLPKERATAKQAYRNLYGYQKRSRVKRTKTTKMPPVKKIALLDIDGICRQSNAGEDTTLQATQLADAAKKMLCDPRVRYWKGANKCTELQLTCYVICYLHCLLDEFLDFTIDFDIDMKKAETVFQVISLAQAVDYNGLEFF